MRTVCGLDFLGATHEYGPRDPGAYVAKMGGKPRTGSMARFRLHSICDLSKELAALIKADEEIPSWCYDFIAVAHDRLHSVYGYIEPVASGERYYVGPGAG
jgi:hypothetical protein